MCRDAPDTEYGTQENPSDGEPSLAVRIGLVLFTILILLASRELWVRYIVLKSNAASLAVLKQFICNSENNQEGFGIGPLERNIPGHTFLEQPIYPFLEQPIYPADFAALSPKQKRIFIEVYYRGLTGIESPPEPEYFHPKIDWLCCCVPKLCFVLSAYRNG